jgi:uncharacterized protein YndB with AHSA1/START domain
MKRHVKIERRYTHPPEAVWRWFATSDAMAEWLMPNTFVPRLGYRFELRTKPAPGFDGIVRCEVLEIDPPNRLAFTWVGGGLNTIVRFELQPAAGGTILRLSHDGFSGPKGVLLSYMLGNGWKGMLAGKLPSLLDRANGEESSGAGCGEKTLFWRLFDRVFSR